LREKIFARRFGASIAVASVIGGAAKYPSPPQVSDWSTDYSSGGTHQLLISCAPADATAIRLVDTYGRIVGQAVFGPGQPGEKRVFLHGGTIYVKERVMKDGQIIYSERRTQLLARYLIDGIDC
jgi:hypothetical protein